MRSAVINLNKPLGLTSQQAVSRVKKILKAGKAGHCGTLDPQASGVLLVCLERTTRLADYFQALPKTYRATLKLGETTDTQDAGGTVIRSADVAGLSESDVAAALNAFVGCIQQVPPMYSALKSEGTPLYRLAREGVEIERPPRTVEIYGISILSMDLPRVTFDVSCSKGTYIRTLCHDVGEILGVGGHLTRLTRTSIGPFRLEDSAPLDTLSEGHLIEPGTALSFMPGCRVPGTSVSRIRNGAPVSADLCVLNRSSGEELRYRLLTEDGDFLGVGVVQAGLVLVERLIAVES